MATVYLIHFHQAIGGENHTARHYLGSTTDLERRIREHQAAHPDKPHSAKLMGWVNVKGIGWEVARTWECEDETTARALERKLKAWKKHKQFCPICRGVHGET